MKTIIINHKVKEYGTWKAGFEADAARRDGMGIELVAVGEKAGDPGNVYVVFKNVDMAVMGQVMSDPEFQNRLESFGVLSTDLTVLN